MQNFGKSWIGSTPTGKIISSPDSLRTLAQTARARFQCKRRYTVVGALPKNAELQKPAGVFF